MNYLYKVLVISQFMYTFHGLDDGVPSYSSIQCFPCCERAVRLPYPFPVSAPLFVRIDALCLRPFIRWWVRWRRWIREQRDVERGGAVRVNAPLRFLDREKRVCGGWWEAKAIPGIPCISEHHRNAKHNTTSFLRALSSHLVFSDRPWLEEWWGPLILCNNYVLLLCSSSHCQWIRGRGTCPCRTVNINHYAPFPYCTSQNTIAIPKTLKGSSKYYSITQNKLPTHNCTSQNTIAPPKILLWHAKTIVLPKISKW